MNQVCTNDGTTIDAHLSYSNTGTTFISDSATYIQQQFQSNGTAGPSPGTPPGTGNNSAALLSLGALLGATATSCPTSTVTPPPAALSPKSPAPTANGAKRNRGLVAFALRSLEARRYER
jgi:hypothetical protein